MIKLNSLDALTDSELDQIEAYSQALKKRRDEERKAKAMEQARAILTAVGLEFTERSLGSLPSCATSENLSVINYRLICVTK
jgi:hypothetical protein